MENSILVKKQGRTFTRTTSEGYILDVRVRYDDECGNGHNTFSITADLIDPKLRSRDKVIACGCLHDEVAKYLPELKPYLKFHLFSSDGPMHYLANALYFASDRDCWGKKKGEPYRFETRVFFNDVPIPMKDYGEKFVEFIKNVDPATLEIKEFEYPRENERKTFKPNYTFNNFNKRSGEKDLDWYGCPFSDRQEAEQILKALRTCKMTFETLPTAWGEGKEPELDKAREVALWPDATLEDFTKEKLEARLPDLIKEFKQAIESLGMVF